jgi:SynChlorMet cassette radical SAM/SPASM protein ScmE
MWRPFWTGWSLCTFWNDENSMNPLRAPISVFVSLTYLCNLRCRHCAVYSEGETHIDLDTQTWMSLFNELADLKVFRLRLSGGEPFMREDIWHLLDRIDTLPMRLAINTNATLIDKGAGERLKGFAKLDEIMVSLDGSCPETHDALRGARSFVKVHAGIEHLCRYNLPVALYCTVNRHNFKDLAQIAALAKAWGIAGVKFNDLLPEGRGLVHYRDLALGRKEWEEALVVLRDLRGLHGTGISGTILDQGEMYEAMEGIASQAEMPRQSNLLSGCGALNQECAVRPDGWITPCDRLPGLKAGHVHEGRFGEIWRTSEVFARFRKRREVLLSDLDECRDCSYHHACSGGCPATPYALYGKVIARDPLGCYRIYSGQETFHVL